MRKIVIHKPGGYERLTIEEHPDLPPGPGEVLIEVAAIGVNYADCVTRMGLYASAKHYIGYPITPGFEVAGKVLSTGSAFSLTTDNHSVLGFNLSFLFGKSALMEQGLQQLVQWLKEGKLRAPRVTTYPFENVADAHRDLESGQTTGKLVLKVQ